MQMVNTQSNNASMYNNTGSANAANGYQNMMPQKINILLLAESPSGNGKHFYKANTPLYRAVRQGFELQFSTFKNDVIFFRFFKAAGCYVDHFCPGAINKTDKQKREANREGCIHSMEERLQRYQPRMIIVLMKSLAWQVKMSLQLSGISNPRW